MAISKITLNGVTQMDVTQKTVTANTMLDGVTSLKADGADITGNIASKSSSDLTANGATVTAPAGYYQSAATKTVASGTAGTPTATKGTVSNHAISVTPSVTNTTGYITGGTKTGTAVSVSASELVSGTKNITSSGTTDVTNYASASVAVGTEGTPTATKGSSTISASWELGAIVTTTGALNDANYRIRTTNYIELNTDIDIIASGTAKFSIRAYTSNYTFLQTDEAMHTEVINVDALLQTFSSYSQIKYFKIVAGYVDDSTVTNVNSLASLITITDHKISVTPSVTNTAGYISGGSHDGTAVSVSASELAAGTKTLTQYGAANVTGLSSVFVGIPLYKGTFTATSGGAAMDITIPYTGSGYPIMFDIFPTEGPYNSTTGTYYGMLNASAMTAIFHGVKSEINTAPAYGSNITTNQMVVWNRYKNSNTTATSYNHTQGTSYMFQNADPTSGTVTIVRMKSLTKLSVYISSGSGNYGFAPNIEYTYVVYYSA